MKANANVIGIKAKVIFNGKVNLNESIKFFKRISYYDTFEDEIIKILNKNKINFELHYNIKYKEKNSNIDFIIIKNKTPIIAIEATKLLSKPKMNTDRVRISHRIAYLDHKFQILKKVYPKLTTIIAIKSLEEKENLIKRIIKREILNTNYYLVNEEINNLPKIINKI